MNGRSQMQGGDFAERDKCKPVLLRLSLAGNLDKPLMYLFGTEWTEGAWLWTQESRRGRTEVSGCAMSRGRTYSIRG